MGKIKPTRVVTPRIVQPNERGVRPWLWVLFLVALGAWSWQVFDFGRLRAGFDVDRHDQELDSLRERIAELEEERDTLRAAAARFERAGQIDRAAADGVKSQVKALQDERADLKREVAFLKTLVSGGDKKLVLNDHSLTEIGERTYRFEVTLAKRTDDQATVSGQVTFAVKGQLDGAETTLEMGRLTEGKRDNIGIRFKSFQRLKAELQLPSGFQPVSIEVAVRPDGRDFRAFEKVYEWKLSDA